jgi:hypothetical protein
MGIWGGDCFDGQEVVDSLAALGVFGAEEVILMGGF